MGIRILPPDVNICGAQFSVDGTDIRFGLAAINGIGESQVSTIMAAREKDGAFKDFDDFCQRVEGVNRKMLEALIKSGAMDCFGLKRSQMMAMCEQAIGLAQQKQKDNQSGQLSLFDMLEDGDEGSKFNSTAIPDIPEWPQNELLQFEKELLGFYISGHPIQEMEWIIEHYQSHDLTDLPSLPHNTTVRVAAYISGVEMKTTRKDNPKNFVILTLETDRIHLECIFFPEDYQRALANDPTIFTKGNIVFIDGEISCKEKEVAKPVGDEKNQPANPVDGETPNKEKTEPTKLIGREIFRASDMPRLFTRELVLDLVEETTTEELLDTFFAIYSGDESATSLTVMAHCRDGRVAEMKGNMDFTPSIYESLTALFGKDNVHLHINRKPTPRPKPKWKFKNDNP